MNSQKYCLLDLGISKQDFIKVEQDFRNKFTPNERDYITVDGFYEKLENELFTRGIMEFKKFITIEKNKSNFELTKHFGNTLVSYVCGVDYNLYTLILDRIQRKLIEETYERTTAKLKEMLLCRDFGEIVEKYGNGKELKKKYDDALKFAPDKNRLIQTSIKTYEVTLKQSMNAIITNDKNGKQINYDTGEYQRTGFAWVNSGYNGSMEDIRVLIYANSSLEAFKANEEIKTLIRTTIISNLAKGGAIAFHLAYLRKELESFKKEPLTNRKTNTRTKKASKEVCPEPSLFNRFDEIKKRFYNCNDGKPSKIQKAAMIDLLSNRGYFGKQAKPKNGKNPVRVWQSIAANYFDEPILVALESSKKNERQNHKTLLGKYLK